jgi:putative inorganic carbon (hco3(-)) transporter
MVKKLFFAALVGALLCGNLLRFNVNLVAFKNVAVVPAELAIVGLGLLLLLDKLRTRRLFVPNSALAGSIGLFVLSALVSLVVNSYYYNLHSFEVSVAAAYLGRWVLYCVPYFMVVDLVRNREELESVWKFLVVGVTIFAVFGILQAFFLPNFAFIVHPDAQAGGYDWDAQTVRLVSTFLDPNFAGCLIAMALASSVAFLEEGYRRVWMLCGVFGLALILTYSRGSVLAFLVAFLYLILTGKSRRRAIAAAFLIGLVLVAAVPYVLPHAQDLGRFTVQDESAQSRVDGWSLCLKVIRDNPVFGIGFNTTPFVIARSAYNWRNGYSLEGAPSFAITAGPLTIFYLAGIFGLVAFCYLYGKVLWMSHCVSVRSKDKLCRAIARSVFAGTIIFVVSSFFTLSILQVFMMGLTWIAFGLLNFAHVRSGRGKVAAAQGFALHPLGADRAAMATVVPGGRREASPGCREVARHRPIPRFR